MEFQLYKLKNQLFFLFFLTHIVSLHKIGWISTILTKSVVSGFIPSLHYTL